MFTENVSFKVSERDRMLITVIVERAILEGLYRRTNARELSMDITAVHANGCPLDLPKLAVARISDFSHDLVGINAYIDCRTGGLKNGFSPRAARHDV